MALKSGGNVNDAAGLVVDANQAIALLVRLHHWSCTKENSNGRSSYSVTITHGGKRVRASAAEFVAAVNAARGKLLEASKPFMRMAGE